MAFHRTSLGGAVTARLERVKKLILPDAISFCYRPTDG